MIKPFGIEFASLATGSAVIKPSGASETLRDVKPSISPDPRTNEHMYFCGLRCTLSELTLTNMNELAGTFDECYIM